MTGRPTHPTIGAGDVADIALSINQQAEAIATRLIQEVAEHKDLKEADIIYLKTSQNMKSGGKVIRGKSTKAGAIVRFFASKDHESVEYGPDFLLIFPEAVWDGASSEKREYIVDHALTQCKKEVKITRRGDVTEKWILVAPDVQAFRSVVERRGFAFPEVAYFADSVRKVDGARQLSFAAERAAESGDSSADDPPAGDDEKANAEARLTQLSRA